ncbi:MAG TPA: PEP-CTERM sorting domain-containing protein [Phycisphaerae bacterium]|nr:PEP-CTERM sorting domain-containing protein [Phycisphaerae bacterium]HRW53249.1 PEP-CTERM sorting domain-containing protein [Phycisphaerae bacterium]
MNFAGFARAALVIVCAAMSRSATAADITFSATQGGRSAAVRFETAGSDLIVMLSNTSPEDALVPIDILTGVFFDVTGAPLTLTPMTAIVPAGSFVHNGPTDPGASVGGEWAYKSNLVGAAENASYGISSSGLGLFGPSDRFPGADLQSPASPDGLQYGITSMGDNLATGNSPLTSGMNALIKYEVVFTLSGLPMGFDPATQITNVQYQYGTDLQEPHFPEPSSLAMLAIGAFAALSRRR